MRDRVLVIQHHPDPVDDRVSTFLTSAGFRTDLRRPFAGEALDEPDETLAGTVILGGAHFAGESGRYPFLRDEYRWIDACLKADVPMLGICLGAQQIAHHLGAPVGAPESGLCEFGYYQVEPTGAAGGFLDRPRWFTQAHFHAFGLPAGAEHLARSDMFENQAFRLGERVYGLQFHPEVTVEGFRRWRDSDWAFHDKPGAQTPDEQTRLMMLHDEAQAKWFYAFLGGLFGKPEVVGG
ncbi:MAG: glutamine amidotransferase [Rhizobiaceae bacterium]